MAAWVWVLLGVAAVAALYALFLVYLLAAGRGQAARAAARFVPDCIVLFRRLVGDGRVARRKKLVLGAVLVYLALPIDLVPDFVPIVGYVDDAVVVLFALRHVLRGSRSLVEEHWPGPAESLPLILRLAGE